MTSRALRADEQRTAPRFRTSFDAELASGTVLVPVVVRDLSMSGCGVVIRSADPDLPDKLGARGLLHFPAVDRGTFGTILPVVLKNVRLEAARLIHGLEFGALLPHQARKLRAVLDVMAEAEAGGSPAPAPSAA